MTASAPGRVASQQNHRHHHQHLRPASSLLAKKDAAIAAAAAARPESTTGQAAHPAASASSLGRRRRSSNGRALPGAAWGCRTDGSSRAKTAKAAAAAGIRVLLPGQGARDYASLLRGSGTSRGRELEARVATAEAEVGYCTVLADTFRVAFLPPRAPAPFVAMRDRLRKRQNVIRKKGAVHSRTKSCN